MVSGRAVAVGAVMAMTVLTSYDATASEAVLQNSALRPLVDCRKITDPAARLSCFDRESAVLEAAVEKKEISVLDKEDVRKTRRSLFGLALPTLPFFGGDDDKKADRPDVDVLVATITAARSLGFGKWQITIDEGAQWQTTEAMVGGSPSAGKKIEIRRGAIGSYMGKMDGSRAVRMKRVN